MRLPVRRSAFTLFEVMISLLILTTAMLATLALLPIGIKAQQLSRSQMFASAASMTLMNNFHTPVTKFEGLSRLAPAYDGVVGLDPTSTAAAPFAGWAGKIRDLAIHASPYQPNLEQQTGWLTGVLPVPRELARRLDSENDEIQRVLDQGGVLLYVDPNFMMGLNQGAAEDKTLQVAAAPELQKLVFAVTSLPQQNALPSLPSESLPWYAIYPFPPEWISMQAVGRETRRVDGAGHWEGQLYFGPNFWLNDPVRQPFWFSGGSRGGWAVPDPSSVPANSNRWDDQYWGPYPGFKRSGMTLSGVPANDFGTAKGMVSWDDAGHGRYEPVKWGRPQRPGQEQDFYFSGDPIDHRNHNDDVLDRQSLATAATAPTDTNAAQPALSSNKTGNGWAQGRNWRFFAAEIGGLWSDGTGAVSAASGYAWDCYQRLAGGDGNLLETLSRDDYAGTAWVPQPQTPNAKYQDPLDPAAPAKFHRSGWLPIKALLTNPDFPSWERLQHLDIWELYNSSWRPLKWPLPAAASGLSPSQPSHPTVIDGNGNPVPDSNFFSANPGMPSVTIATTDDLRNFTWKSAAPPTVAPLATYEMRANYRDRAIDLWQAVMPANSVPGGNVLQKNMGALVRDDEGGTMVDCNKYEYGPLELDKFKFIRPDQLAAADLPIHPAQVLALSHLAHAAMMVTGYDAPFSGTLQSKTSVGETEIIKVPWECLNWTYAKSPLNTIDKEVSLWSTNRPNNPAGVPLMPFWGPAGLMKVPQPVNPNSGLAIDRWERPFPYEYYWWLGGGAPWFEPDPWRRDATMPASTRGQAEPYKNAQWDPRRTQQFPVLQEVTGQGVTKDAMVVMEDVLPAATSATCSYIKLYNDTTRPWMLYPGDELVFQISYYQWWYKYGKGGITNSFDPSGRRGNYVWGQDDAHSIWDGRYDPDSQWWHGTWGGPLPKYPNARYQLQTFRVVAVTPNGGATYTEASGPPPQVAGNGPRASDAAAHAPAQWIEVAVVPPVPWYPKQFNDARESVPLYPPADGVMAKQDTVPYAPAGPGERDPISFHKNTLVRRIANAHDRVFARKVYEMAMQWAAAYAAESPYDAGAPKPANRQVMMDRPLALYDLFYDAGAGTGNGSAVRVPLNPPTSDGSSAALSGRRTESFYRWMTGYNAVPDSWFPSGSPTHGRHSLSGFGPGRERQDYFKQMVYNDSLRPPSAGQDEDRFWLTKPFAAFHRCRTLKFWSVDWKAYEDAETAPSAPADMAKHLRYPRRSPTGADAYDVIAPWVEYGHNPLGGLPESLYVWTSPARRQRYVDVAGGEGAGYLYQNWIGPLNQPRSGINDGNGYATTVDPPATDGQPVSADVHLGHWGADRNGNGVLDVGPVPRGSRMRAVHVADFIYYDPVLRVHHGN